MLMWLVTGGAGYIGSHVVRELQGAGCQVRVLDDLSTGIRARLPNTVDFRQGDIRNEGDLIHALSDVDGVIHLAGKKSVSESVMFPLTYWDVNTVGTVNLLRAMQYASVHRLIFSSTAAVYAPQDTPITEDGPLAPASPYGSSKLAAEQAISDIALAFQIQHVSLRYFNVAGAISPDLRDLSRDNLIPSALRRIRDDEPPLVFGDDYVTRDGTAVRDYVHVQDVARAHVAAATNIDMARSPVFNVGTGTGATVLEVITGLLQRGDSSLVPVIADRREGDPAHTVANVDKIRDELGWMPEHDLSAILASALQE